MSNSQNVKLISRSITANKVGVWEQISIVGNKLQDVNLYSLTTEFEVFIGADPLVPDGAATITVPAYACVNLGAPIESVWIKSEKVDTIIYGKYI